jgi:hypothetical protein
MSHWQKGDRVRLQGEVGTITEIVEDRRVARIKMDDGRGVCCDLRLLLAAHEESPQPAARSPQPDEEEPKAPPVVQDKMIRGPVGKRKR